MDAENDYAKLMEADKLAPATWFQTPVDWADPVVLLNEGQCYPTYRGGFRASVFADYWRRENERKYSRGLCHAHALAACEEHGGQLCVLMQDHHVVHVLSLHHREEDVLLRDVFGDMPFSDREAITLDAMQDLSDQHLLGTKLTDILFPPGDGSGLPCKMPTAEEIAEARKLSTVTRQVQIVTPTSEIYSDHALSF